MTLSCDDVPSASNFAFEIEYDAGGNYQAYYTYQGTTPSRTFWPSYHDTTYRWRVRAKTGGEWSPDSAWTSFAYGNVASDPPDTEPEPKPEPEPGGAPTGLAPSAGASISTPSVTLSCDAYVGASQYAFEIEYQKPTSQYGTYFTYQGGSPTRTFNPVYHGATYRWRVRAQTSTGWSPNSAWTDFEFK